MMITVAKGDAVGVGTERTETAGAIVVEAPGAEMRRSKYPAFLPINETH